MSEKIDILTYFRPEDHYERFIKHIGNFDAWGKNKDQCCLWKLKPSHNGYGRFGIYVRRKRFMIKAHRLAFYIFNDYKLPKYNVCHAPIICHNPLCCNPLHLMDDTPAVNMSHKKLDGTDTRYSNTYKLVSPEGEEYTTSKLPGFCTEHGLKYKTVISSANLERKMKSGWKIEIIENLHENQKGIGTNTYHLTCPKGEEHTTDNLMEFCKIHGLKYTTMTKAVSRGCKQLKSGWKIEKA